MGYWEFYNYPKTKAKEVKDGIKTKSKRGEIGETWWSKRWVAVLESFNMGARLSRGRAYARKGQVVSIDIEKGIVKAKVQGSYPKPYDVTIKLKEISEKEWDSVAEAMASQAIFAAKLLAGEMPKNIEEAFSEKKAHLFPESRRDLDTNCSCPDSANPCKHIAAVYYILAERFDDDPFLIFKLRGMTKEGIISALREKRSKAMPEAEASPLSSQVSKTHQPIMEKLPRKSLKTHPSTAAATPAAAATPMDLKNFWSSSGKFDTFSSLPSAPDVNNSVVKILGDSPFEVDGKNIASHLSEIYDAVTREAIRRSMEDTLKDNV